ncbi:3-keto-disaccharide hydrolase [Gelidibacter pelagius]|uniref:DUF1080 domain-containing protein n=1 Tax=Gelidibacter pelagius TaxID=2819985 RepID=A0ABS3SU04_9FLAO|nr:DUF1080 domain-containing protein [Gelidibacter pelagius]MBO3099179.1 DUF1080 domain-containing protein [Gelidibacter pelagius]
MTKIVMTVLLALSIIACKDSSDTKKQVEEGAITQEDSKSDIQKTEVEWQYLFDGTTLEGWRGYNEDKMPPGWVINNGELTYDTELGLEQDYTGGRDIIYGAEEFDNFELYLEWKLPKGGNSGIFYHIKEGYPAPYDSAPEYQLIDDDNYAQIHDLTGYNKSVGHTENLSELKPLNKTAADYAMHGPDLNKKKLNPVGEWNSSKIVFTPEKVEHWLNGQKVLSFVPWDDEWDKKKNSGKWKESPNYGKYKSGFIGLQDHASPIWFRNIKIRKL